MSKIATYIMVNCCSNNFFNCNITEYFLIINSTTDLICEAEPLYNLRPLDITTCYAWRSFRSVLIYNIYMLFEDDFFVYSLFFSDLYFVWSLFNWFFFSQRVIFIVSMVLFAQCYALLLK